jgi:hypothetical protein
LLSIDLVKEAEENGFNLEELGLDMAVAEIQKLKARQ